MAKATEIIEIEAKSNIKEVTKDVDKLGKSVKDTAGEAKKLKPATEAGASGFKKVGIAVRALGVAIKAIGIGLLISGFMALKEAFMRNQKAADFLKTSMTTISITFNEVVDVIVRMVEWVQKNSDQFEPYVKVMKGVVTLGIEPLKLAFNTTEIAIRSFIDGFMRLRKFLGEKGLQKSIDENMRVIENLQDKIEDSAENIGTAATDIWENFGDANDIMNKFWGELDHQIRKIDVKKNYDLANAITETGNAAAIADIKNQKLSATYKKDAEVQRQIRDDVRNTLAVRMEANKKLGETLKKQQELQSAEIQSRIDAAKLLVEADAKNLEAKLNLGREELEMMKLKEEITGQQSEQLTNQAALELELAEIKKTLALEGEEGMERELLELKQNYEDKLELARKAGEETTALTEKNAKDEQAIRDTYAQKQIDLDQKVADVKQKTLEMGAAAAIKIAGEGSVIGKSVAVAMAIMNTKNAITAALGATPYGPWNIAQAVATGVFGMLQVKDILATPIPGGGGGGGGIVIPNATPVAPSPEMMSGGSGFNFEEPEKVARAYVVSDDITNNQNKLAIIRRRATI